MHNIYLRLGNYGLAKAIVWLFIMALFPLVVDAEIREGTGRFIFLHQGKEIPVWYYNPSSVPKNNIPIVFVMHGVKRNAETYRDDWVQYAREKNFLLIVPEFSSRNYPGEKYNTGNMIGANGEIGAKETWLFQVIEKIFHKIQLEKGIKTEKYYLYGHSAGAQFVHRFTQFFPEASLELAIAANAGWYTFLDNTVAFPYGIKDLMLSKQELNTIFSKKLIVLLGDKDTNSLDASLRKTYEANIQGIHRFERGNTYFNNAQKLSQQLGDTFNWKMVHVKGVAHSNTGMAEEASQFIK